MKFTPRLDGFLRCVHERYLPDYAPDPVDSPALPIPSDWRQFPLPMDQEVLP